MNQWLSVKDAAAELGLATSAIYVLVGQKRITCYRIGPNGGRIRFKVSDLAEYVESTRSGPRPKAEAPPRRERYVPRYDINKPMKET